jgi:IclR family transcriptional regulator, acetate operon repressor
MTRHVRRAKKSGRGKKRAIPVESVESSVQLNADSDFLAAVDRTMRTIEMLADEADGLSTSDVARKLDVNKQIAVRILHTLLQAGYAFQTPDQLYKLTYKIGNIGFRQLSTARLTDQCVPLIRELALETGELVRLAVIEADRPIWLYAASGRVHRLRLDPVWPAEILPHAHAVGKVMLSTLDEDEIARRVGPEPFPQETPRTVTTMATLMANVRSVRKLGYAVSCEEAEPGVGAIAAPVVVGSPIRLVAIVSIAAPTARVSCEALKNWAPRLIKLAGQLADVWPL